jgi:hypothetical protein
LSGFILNKIKEAAEVGNTKSAQKAGSLCAKCRKIDIRQELPGPITRYFDIHKTGS